LPWDGIFQLKDLYLKTPQSPLYMQFVQSKHFHLVMTVVNRLY